VHSIIRDENGRFVPVVRPKQWQPTSVKRSRERTDRIALARKRRKAWQATTEWMSELDRRGVAALEATGIPWAAVQRWIDELEPRDAFVARRLVRQVLQTLADGEAPLRERLEARNELYRRMIAAGIVD
jgi:hypothetical protein